MSVTITKQEQRFLDEMVIRGNPSNARCNPETAEVLAVMQPEVSDEIVGLFERKQRAAGEIGIAVAREVSGSNIDLESASDGLTQFLWAAVDASMIDSFGAIRATVSGDSTLLAKFAELAAPLIVAIRDAVLLGTTVDELGERV